MPEAQDRDTALLAFLAAAEDGAGTASGGARRRESRLPPVTQPEEPTATAMPARPPAWPPLANGRSNAVDSRTRVARRSSILAPAPLSPSLTRDGQLSRHAHARAAADGAEAMRQGSSHHAAAERVTGTRATLRRDSGLAPALRRPASARLTPESSPRASYDSKRTSGIGADPLYRFGLQASPQAMIDKRNSLTMGASARRNDIASAPVGVRAAGAEAARASRRVQSGLPGDHRGARRHVSVAQVEVTRAVAIAAAKTDLRDARAVLQRMGSASTHASTALDAELARLEAVQRDLDMQAQEEQRRRGPARQSASDADGVTDENNVLGPQKRGGAHQSLADLAGQGRDGSGLQDDGSDGWVDGDDSNNDDDGASRGEGELEHRAVSALGEALGAMATATAPRWNVPGDSPASPTGSGRS